MTNRLAECNLQKQLLNLSAELHRQLTNLHKDKLDAREFIVKVRRCDSNNHPNALRYLAGGKGPGLDSNGITLPPVPDAMARQKKYQMKIRQMMMSRGQTSPDAKSQLSLPQIKGSSAKSVKRPTASAHAKPSLQFMRASERNYQMQSIKYRNYEKITSLSIDFLL
ncbi:uncharacterized protein [Watersipora subatra]|uniref:uncharacterized protein n=1 Tax=Watersipora subatra TaxID=2589382 RepID=UPI00355B6174